MSNIKNLFGNGNDTTKVVVKTAKGGGPIRKVKMAISAGTLAVILSPILEPLFLKFLGHVPEGGVQRVAELLISNYEFVVTILTAYWTRPGANDGIATEVSSLN